MTSPYTPVSCSFHDRLEAIATTRKSVRIVFRTPTGDAQRNAGISDVFARNEAEYLVLSTGETVRLDQLLIVDD